MYGTNQGLSATRVDKRNIQISRAECLDDQAQIHTVDHSALIAAGTGTDCVWAEPEECRERQGRSRAMGRGADDNDEVGLMPIPRDRQGSPAWRGCM